MNPRQLIAALAENADMDTEVTLWAHDLEGTYRQWTISQVTTAVGADGVHRTDLTIATVGPPPGVVEYGTVMRPIDTSGMTGDGGTVRWPSS